MPPTIGVERRGAPVVSFTRVSSGEIRERCEIYEPDHLIVLDPVLIDSVNITSGLKEGGWIIINTNRPIESGELTEKYHVAIVDANSIAIKYGLGSRATPIVNTAILGAFSRASGLLKIETVMDAVRQEVPAKREENADAAMAAYHATILE